MTTVPVQCIDTASVWVPALGIAIAPGDVVEVDLDIARDLARSPLFHADDPRLNEHELQAGDGLDELTTNAELDAYIDDNELDAELKTIKPIASKRDAIRAAG